MPITVPFPPLPVLWEFHDEQHVVKDRPSLYTTRHFDAVVLAKALGRHSHEFAVSTSGLSRHCVGRGRCDNGGRVRGAAGVAQCDAVAAAADK